MCSISHSTKFFQKNYATLPCFRPLGSLKIVAHHNVTCSVWDMWYIGNSGYCHKNCTSVCEWQFSNCHCINNVRAWCTDQRETYLHYFAGLFHSSTHLYSFRFCNFHISSHYDICRFFLVNSVFEKPINFVPLASFSQHHSIPMHCQLHGPLLSAILKMQKQLLLILS